jgi:hypothetical protein
MKNAKNFITREIIKLNARHNDLSCKYGFDSLSHVHFVEIGPEDKINDHAVKETLAEMMFSFYGTYPEESVVFLSTSERIQARYPAMSAVMAKKSAANTQPAIH